MKSRFSFLGVPSHYRNKGGAHHDEVVSPVIITNGNVVDLVDEMSEETLMSILNILKEIDSHQEEGINRFGVVRYIKTVLKLMIEGGANVEHLVGGGDSDDEEDHTKTKSGVDVESEMLKAIKRIVEDDKKIILDKFGVSSEEALRDQLKGKKIDMPSLLTWNTKGYEHAPVLTDPRGFEGRKATVNKLNESLRETYPEKASWYSKAYDLLDDYTSYVEYEGARFLREKYPEYTADLEMPTFLEFVGTEGYERNSYLDYNGKNIAADVKGNFNGVNRVDLTKLLGVAYDAARGKRGVILFNEKIDIDEDSRPPITHFNIIDYGDDPVEIGTIKNGLDTLYAELKSETNKKPVLNKIDSFLKTELGLTTESTYVVKGTTPNALIEIKSGLKKIKHSTKAAAPPAPARAAAPPPAPARAAAPPPAPAPVPAPAPAPAPALKTKITAKIVEPEKLTNAQLKEFNRLKQEEEEAKAKARIEQSERQKAEALRLKQEREAEEEEEEDSKKKKKATKEPAAAAAPEPKKKSKSKSKGKAKKEDEVEDWFNPLEAAKLEAERKQLEEKKELVRLDDRRKIEAEAVKRKKDKEEAAKNEKYMISDEKANKFIEDTKKVIRDGFTVLIAAYPRNAQIIGQIREKHLNNIKDIEESHVKTNKVLLQGNLLKNIIEPSYQSMGQIINAYGTKIDIDRLIKPFIQSGSINDILTHGQFVNKEFADILKVK
jgi:hypothetical protein